MQKTIVAWLLISAVALALAACGGGGGEKGGTVQSKVGNVSPAKAMALASAFMKSVALDAPVPVPVVNATPILVSPQNGDTWGGHVVKFQWTPVSDAAVASYHIQVGEMGGGPIIYNITGLTSTSIDLMLFDDNYEWQVYATNAAGTDIATSETWYCQVLNSDTAPPDCGVTWPTGADTGPPDVSVTSPNGGETLTGGSDVTITWTGADDLTPSSQLSMGVYYSLDNGRSWSTITRSTTNSGSTVWTVPNVNSDQCLIRVLGRDRELKVGVDTSDSVCSIVADPSKSLETVSQDSDGGKSETSSSNYIRGESLIGGQYYTITWYALDDITPTYDLKIVLYFSSDGGSSWSEITSLSNNYGAYYWQAPNLTSNKCMIKLYAIDEHSKTGVAVSSSVYTITQSSSAAWPSSNGSQISTVTSPSNITLASSNCTVTDITDSKAPTGGPAGFTGAKQVSFRATGVTNTANITLTFPTLPVNPVFMKVVNGVWKQLYPTNEWAGISSVALTGNTLSYTIADNSDADADPAVGVVADPVVAGQLATPGAVTNPPVNPDTNPPAGAVNNPPASPVLISPVNNLTGAATTMTFTWKKSADPDGDVVKYHFMYSDDPAFATSETIDVAAAKAAGLLFAGLGSMGGGLLLFGFVAGNDSRRSLKSVLAAVALILLGTLFTACGGGSSSTLADTSPPPDQVVSTTVTDLAANTTYYWKVVADDGKGGLATSEVFSCKTQ